MTLAWRNHLVQIQFILRSPPTANDTRKGRSIKNPELFKVHDAMRTAIAKVPAARNVHFLDATSFTGDASSGRSTCPVR